MSRQVTQQQRTSLIRFRRAVYQDNQGLLFRLNEVRTGEEVGDKHLTRVTLLGNLSHSILSKVNQTRLRVVCLSLCKTNQTWVEQYLQIVCLNLGGVCHIGQYNEYQNPYRQSQDSVCKSNMNQVILFCDCTQY